MSATDRLIDETLRLDGEATSGPWMRYPQHFPGDGGRLCDEHDISVAYTPIASASGPRGTFCIDAEQANINAALIASYRTAAPRLARMLRVAVDALNDAALRYGEPESRRALAEIEKIAKEEA